MIKPKFIKRTISGVISLALMANFCTVFPINSFADDADIQTLTDENGHRYEIFDNSMSWTDAEEYCESLGGHLVTITSEEEQKYIIDSLLTKGNKGTYFIGLTRDNSSTPWNWVTGEEFEYSNWDYGEPNNTTENYVHLYYGFGNIGTWNNTLNFVDGTGHYSTSDCGFICEWESEDSTITVENKMKQYALFSASDTTDFEYTGWKTNIKGNVYSGSSFRFSCSEISIDGRLDAVKSIAASGWKININEQNESIDSVDTIDYDKAILDNAQPYDYYEDSMAYIEDATVINKSIKVSGNVEISSTSFKGDCYIIADGNITYNVDDFDTDGRVFLYSQNGNVIINGSTININGGIYAPNGNVSFNTYETELSGFVWADSITYSGSIFNVDGGNFDMIEPRSVAKTYTTDKDFSDGTFNGLGIEIPNELTLEKNSDSVIPFEDRVYGDTQTGKGVKVTCSADKSFVSGINDEVTVKYGLSGFGEADVAENAVDLVIVVDESGSMSGARMSSTKSAAKQIVSQMKENDRCAVVGFTEYSSVKQKLTSDKKLVETAIDKLNASGGTSIYVGIDSALDMFSKESDINRQKYIILLSDGEDGNSTRSLQSAANAAKNNVRIFSMKIGTGTLQMQNIAINSNGIYKNAPSAEDIAKIMSYFASEVFNVAGRNTTFRTTVKDISSIDMSDVTPEPSKIINNKDGSAVVEWNIDRITIDEKEEISIPLKVKNASSGYIDLLENTNCVFYDRNGKPNTVYVDDISMPVSKYVHSGRWSVVFDSEREVVDWGNIYWNGRRYGDGEIEVYVSVSDDGETFSEPVKAENHKELSGISGRYAKISVNMTASSDGRSPELYDITILSKDTPQTVWNNSKPYAGIISKGVAKVNVPINVRANISDDCLKSDITVEWSCEDENVKFLEPSKLFTSVICQETGSFDIICTVDDGEGISQSVKTIICEPADSYADINPEYKDEAAAPKISVTLPDYADRNEKINAKIDKLNNTEISWCSVIFNNKSPIEVSDGGEFTLTMPDSDGTYKVVIRAFDWSGKSDIKEYSIKVDSTAAIVDIKPSASEVTIGSDAYFKVSVSGKKKVKELSYTLNGKSVTIPEDGFLKVDTSSEVEYLLEATGLSTDGNEISASSRITVMSGDTEKPVVKITFDKNIYFEKQEAIFTVTATDNVDVASISVLVNGKEVKPDSSGKCIISDLKYGDYVVTVNASDTSGNIGTATQKITAKDITDPKLSVKADKTEIMLGDTVNITINASDNNGIASTEFTVRNEKLSLSKDSVVKFTPVESGEYIAKVTATDESGNKTEKSITIIVSEPDTINPVVSLTLDKDTYFELDDIIITVKATDNIGVTKTALFIDGKEVAVSEDGTYTISKAVLKEYEIVFHAYDAEGNETISTTFVPINKAEAPIISVLFDKEIYNEGDDANGLVTVQGQAKIISLTATVNGNPLAIEDGVFSLSSLSAGEYTFVFTAEDTKEKTSTINKAITVIKQEQKPDEILYADVEGLVKYGETTVYRAEASDEIDKSTISLTLNGKQIKLDSNYTYLFKGEKLFDNEFVLTAKTKSGETVTVKNTVRVYEKVKPTLDVTLSKSADIHEGDNVIITVKAEDASGIRKIMCTYDGIELPLDENGQITLSNFDYNTHTMLFRAWDNFDNLTTKMLTFYTTETVGADGEKTVSFVSGDDETDSKLLTADIVTPLNEAVISGPAPIVGKASGTDFRKYRLEYQSVAGGQYTLIKEGNQSVNMKSLGEFDPTMLRNGLYNIRLTVWGENGITLEDNILVSVEGSMKIGNFSLDFQDIDVNAGGLPITLVRGYDSRDRITSGDFGYGWNISNRGIKITKSCDLSNFWDLAINTSYSYIPTKPHIVSVDWGNGKVEKFVMQATSEGIATARLASFSFVPLNGSNTELIPVITTKSWQFESNHFFKFDSEYNEVSFNPNEWIVKKADGTKYRISCTEGLISYEDINGNKVSFNRNSISDTNNNEIQIERDSKGRIVKIVSSSSKSVEYTYDENGDLVKVTDVSGYETSYEYDNHYLTAIIDSRGVTVSRNIYDDNGRLIKTVDADGNEITYNHDIYGREETITDRNGGVTHYVYDYSGNIVSQTDPMGNTVKNTYDSNGNITSKTDALGNVTEYFYDESGNLKNVIDAEGNTVANTYDTKGLVTSINAMGVDVIKISYDEKGNTTSTEDALGNVINYDYDSKGNLKSVTDEIGTYMNMTYDSNGNVLTATNGEGTTAEFTYDSNGNCLTKTLKYTSDGKLKSVTEYYTYDEAGNLTQIKDSDGNITSTEYNSLGKIAVATDERGRQTSYNYDDLGNLIEIKYADGTAERFSYDREGNNLTATDRLGRTVTMKYDKVGNLLSKKYPNGSVVKYSYDANYNLISTVSASGNETKYEYDRIGRNTAITDALGNRNEFAYNSQSLLESMTDAKGNVYTYSYDANGNRTKTTYPDGSSVSSGYDARGRVVSQTDQSGNKTSYVYDVADRLTSVKDALGNVTSYEYDEVGNLIKVTDAKKNVTLYSYDDFGRVIKTANALGKTAEASYDKCGNILSSTDFGGKLTTYSYDEFDRIASKETADGTVKYSYTPDGKLASVTDVSGTAKYSYDDMDGLAKVEYPDGKYVSYTYDDANRLTSIETAYGITSYEYDKLDRLVRVIDRNGYATVYEYDANGNRTSVKYANGITVSYDYDEVNRLIKEKALDKQGGLVAQYEYTLGAAGERTKVKELDRTVEYTYDALYRLTGETITEADGTATEYTYAYDNVSNRILKTENGAETAYSYNALNQLVKENNDVYKYDDAGNLVSVTSAGKTTVYTYNAENKLIRATVQEGNDVSVEEYEYDYAGNRTAKKSENDYTYYLNDISGGLTQVIAELDADGNEKCFYTRGAELISQERSGNVSYYLTDGHGSVRQLANGSGEITDTYAYDAWGNLILSTGETENSYLYCGEQIDSATGLYYLRARYMNPTTGTFTSMDTYQGSMFDPVSLHKYLYANANPMTFVDPSGYSADFVEVQESFIISDIIDKAANTAASFALNYYWKFKATLPVIISAVTGMAAYLSDSPEFADICSGIASGDVSINDINQMIIETFDSIRSIWDNICEMSNRSTGSSGSNSSGSGGSSGSSMPEPPDPNKLNHIFDKAQHNLQDFLNFFKGNQSEAYRAVEQEAQRYVTQNHIEGVINSANQITINISGHNITFRGYVDNGILRLGTFFII